MSRPVASDLGLYNLPTSHKKDARLIWVNHNMAMCNTYKSVNTSCICRALDK